MTEYENYVIILDRTDARTIRRIINKLLKHDITIQKIIIAIKVKNSPSNTGVLGGVRNIDPGHVFVERGILILPLLKGS